MDKISFIANGKEISEGGAIKLDLSFIKGKSVDIDEKDIRLITNELPLILHALKQNDTLSVDANDCFTYTFPFKLARGHGFPYVFDFALEGDGLLTLT